MTTRYEGCIVETTISGKLIKFFVANRADLIQTHHFHAQFYEAEELGLITKFFRPEGAFIDVGSNVGNHAIFVSKFLEPRSVLVFEPNPAAISILRINLALNGCLNVDTRFLGVALGAASGRVRLEERDENNLGSARFVPDETGGFLTITGDSVLMREAPSFIKIDIEGMEMEVLAGLAETISSWRPNMFIEVQSCNLSQFNSWRNATRYKVAGQHQRYEGIINFMVVPE
jgi:FkbM family methyltransferase